MVGYVYQNLFSSISKRDKLNPAPDIKTFQSRSDARNLLVKRWAVVAIKKTIINCPSSIPRLKPSKGMNIEVSSMRRALK